ncbi:MAG: hypothetical protein ACTSRI_20230 [Promethearchaeota archaeon]
MWKLPPILIFVALFSLIIYPVSKIISSEQVLKEYLNIYFVVLGIAIALASVTFSYASVIKESPNRQKVIFAGESFLGAVVITILATLITWLSDKINTSFQSLSYYNLTMYVVVAIRVLGEAFLVIVLLNLYSGLFNLQEALFKKIRKNVLQ